MREKEIKDSLEAVLKSIELIESRFKSIHKAADFIATPSGVTKMDSIAMRLQVIGERFKKLDAKVPGLLEGYGIDPKPIIRFRDFISHHYEEADYEVLYNVCKVHLPELKVKILLSINFL
jgi:uncharacterized protein with HEPN domain